MKRYNIKNCAPFTNCISEINNTQTNNAKEIDVVMQMYNLKKYSDNYCKTFSSLLHYYRDESFLANDAMVHFPVNNNSASFKFKIKTTGRIGNGGTKNVKIRVSLRYKENFWRTTEMSLIKCKINLILTWSD